MATPAGIAPVVVTLQDQATGSAPLTWGQRNLRQASAQNPPGMFNLSRVITPPRRVALDPGQAAGVVGALLSRHESLRTVYPAGPAGPAGPRQQVRGTVALALSQVTDGGDAAAAAEALRADLTGPAFDDAGELPLRVGLVTTGGTVVRIVLALSHLAADQAAVDILERELRLLALRGRIAGPPGLQPRELAAREERSGRRIMDAAYAHWESLYRQLPPAMFDRAGPAHEPLCQRVRLRSPALPPALRLLAGAHQVSTGTVLLAATAAVVARRTGHRMVAIGTLVGNRHQAGHQDMVTSLVQLGMWGLDLTGGTGGELAGLIAPTWRAALRTYRHAHYDPDELWPRLDKVGLDRGRRIDPLCCFNDLRVAPDLGLAGGDPVALRAQLAATREQTTLHSEPPIPPMRCRFCLQVRDEPGAVALRLAADTRFLPPDQIREFLRETERLVLDTAATAAEDRP